MTHWSKGDSGDASALLEWQSIDNSLFKLDDNTLLVRTAPLTAPPTNHESHYPHRLKAMPLYHMTFPTFEITAWP